MELASCLTRSRNSDWVELMRWKGKGKLELRTVLRKHLGYTLVFSNDLRPMESFQLTPPFMKIYDEKSQSTQYKRDCAVD